MLDWHSFQICYPLEIKILLLLYYYCALAFESPDAFSVQTDDHPNETAYLLKISNIFEEYIIL